MLQHDEQRHAPSLRRPVVRPVVAPVWERTLRSRRLRPAVADPTDSRTAPSALTRSDAPAR